MIGRMRKRNITIIRIIVTMVTVMDAAIIIIIIIITTIMGIEATRDVLTAAAAIAVGLGSSRVGWGCGLSLWCFWIFTL